MKIVDVISYYFRYKEPVSSHVSRYNLWKYRIASFMRYLIVGANYRGVLRKIRGKVVAKSQINVCFLVSEPSKWNVQQLYEAFDKSAMFQPFVVVTKLEYSMDEQSYKQAVKIFKRYVSRVYEGYDVDTHKSVELDRFGADIVFYQQPWELQKNQSVYQVARYALTCYLSYAIEDAETAIRENTVQFYSLLFKYFVFSMSTEAELKNRFGYCFSNLEAVGHPKLDVYADYNPDNYQHNYVIYAPHHTVIEGVGNSYGTFAWSGRLVLDWAKKHTNIKWVFKPHPKLKGMLIKSHVMTPDEVEEYYKEWSQVGWKYEEGNYFDIFKNSRCMITDCGSFLTEYLPTMQPVIHLRNKRSQKHSVTNTEIMEHYYKCYAPTELEALLDSVLLKSEDPMKEERKQIIQHLNLKQHSASQKVVNVILNLVK